MFEKFTRVFSSSEGKKLPTQEELNAVRKMERDKLRAENITPGFPHLSASVSERRNTPFQTRTMPAQIQHEGKVFKKDEAGGYVNSDGEILSLAIVATLIGLSMNTSTESTPASPGVEPGDGKFGGGGASGGFDGPDDLDTNISE